VRTIRRAARVAVLLLAGGGALAGAQQRSGAAAEELMNPLLSPRYALWLVGPIARMASREEVRRFLAATDDGQAEAVIEEFWRRRDTAPEFPGNPLREDFEKRAEEADRRLTEAGVPGHRTDRGTLFVLYGEPQEERFDISEHPDDPPTLIWTYPANAGKGLDGKRPDRTYRFIKRGELTTFFTPNRRPPRPRLQGPP
jgi:GWxTD domain-containing protein